MSFEAPSDFDDLYRKHYKDVRAKLYRCGVRQTQELQDAASDLFLMFFEKDTLGRYDPSYGLTFRNYLLGIVGVWAPNYRRKYWRMRDRHADLMSLEMQEDAEFEEFSAFSYGGGFDELEDRERFVELVRDIRAEAAEHASKRRISQVDILEEIVVAVEFSGQKRVDRKVLATQYGVGQRTIDHCVDDLKAAALAVA